MTTITMICLLALVVVVERTIHVAAHLNIHRYTGHTGDSSAWPPTGPCSWPAPSPPPWG